MAAVAGASNVLGESVQVVREQDGGAWVVHAPDRDVDAREWVRGKRDELLEHLRRAGHLVLRGLTLGGPSGFEATISELVDEWMSYRDRASVRSKVAGRVMTSTDTPPAFAIHQHCEGSFTARWPRHIFFFCELPAARGGRTPITDMRGVTRALDSALLAKFAREGVMYVRNFHAQGKSLGMDWRDVFQVAGRSELERYCDNAAIRVEWLDNERLRTVQVRPAMVAHPETGERVWFNHTLALHASALDEQLLAGLLRQVGEVGLPNNVFFGSGEPISADQIAAIHDAHARNTVTFTWQVGDVLLLDNVLSAHGREPYEGERRVYTLMANPHTWQACGQTLRLPAHAPCFAAQETIVRSRAQAGDTATIGAWLLAAVARELQVDRAMSGDNFEDLGGDSLAAVALVDELHDEFGIELGIETVMEADTLADIISKLG